MTARTVAAIAILIACCSNDSIAEMREFKFHSLEFTFYDGLGKKYKNSTVEGQLIDEYGNDLRGIKLLLIETPSFDNPLYKSQNKIIHSLPHGTAEELKILYIVSCTEAEYKDGYHTSIKTAKILSQGYEGFRIRLFDNHGFIHFESVSPVSEETLKYWARKLDKKE